MSQYRLSLAHALAFVGTAVSLVGAVPGVAAAAGSGNPRDQIVLSGSVDVPAGRTVGTVVVVDGPINVAGTVKGDIVAVHGVVRISGFVDGTVTAVSRRVILTPGARIQGDLLYGGPRPLIPAGAAVTGKVSSQGLTKLDTTGFGVLAYLILWLAFSISALALGALVWWLAPGAMEAASEAFQQRTGPVIGWGFGLFLGLPLAAIIAVVSLVGIPLGAGLLLALLPLSAIGYVTTAWVIGRMALGGQRNPIVIGLVGLAGLRVVALIPWFGGLVWLVATVMGLGALLVAIWQARQSRTTSQTPAPAAA